MCTTVINIQTQNDITGKIVLLTVLLTCTCPSLTLVLHMEGCVILLLEYLASGRCSSP
jgi:hypothetical protein